jgi:bifunctional ADP-heptose synthase (sugar kinase/adenylyltransferase)
VGHEVVEAYGGTVCVTGAVDGISTTNILASLARGETAAALPGASPLRKAS